MIRYVRAEILAVKCGAASSQLDILGLGVLYPLLEDRECTVGGSDGKRDCVRLLHQNRVGWLTTVIPKCYEVAFGQGETMNY